MVHYAVWEELVSAVNQNLVVNTTIATKKDTRHRPTSVSELQRFYGIVLVLENTYSNETHNMREHYKILKKRYAISWPWKMGYDRFTVLMR